MLSHRPFAQDSVRASARARSERRRRVLTYAARRLALVPVGLFLIATGAFAITNLTPSDPVRAILGPLAPPAAVESMRAKLGLDQSVWQRYVDYLGDLRHGRLGESYYTQAPVGHEMLSRLPASLAIVIPGIVLGIILGVGVGGLGAYFHDGWIDRGTKAFVSLNQAVPEFVVGLVASYLLFYSWGVLPAPGGQINFADQRVKRVTGVTLIDALIAGNLDTARSALLHLILPVLTIMIGTFVVFAKISRAVQAEALQAAHTEFARAAGLRERTVFLHALRTTTAALLTYVAVVVGGAIGGVAIVEVLFSWPGIGAWAVDVMLKRDLPAVQGFVLLSGAITFLVYIVADILIRLADPRVADRD